MKLDNVDNLSTNNKFEIILYKEYLKYENLALEKLILNNNLIKLKDNIYQITKEDIEEVFSNDNIELKFYDKIKILSRKIFSKYRGNGIIDILLDMKIDGISGGVSGNSNDKSNVWIFFQGKNVKMSFLVFESKNELQRICKNIYRFNTTKQLSKINGYVVSEMIDGSRVAVARPPFCENYVFFVRKFNLDIKGNINKIVNNKNLVEFLKYLIFSELVIGITGDQGCGKTTLLTSLVEFIDGRYNIRVHELSFELNLRQIYPNRNIVTFRETDSISGQEALDFQKKTDGTVSIVGEVASDGVASSLIQTAMVASKFTLFTHHAKTTKNLVTSIRNSLISTGKFSNEVIATNQVISVLDIDIHMVKDNYGNRFIERITEITKNTEIITKDIIVIENGKYVLKNLPSKHLDEKIKNNLGEKYREYKEYISKMSEKYYI